MQAFAIMFHGRRFLAHSRTPKQPCRGWRPFRWSGVEEAEKFGSRAAAELFLSGLPYRNHPAVTVVELRAGGVVATT